MVVELLNYTPVELIDKALTKCWDKEVADPRGRMYKVCNKYKHSSALEHVSLTFDIDGISRACLQELARHRMTSLTVKSTRYTLKELKGKYNPLDYLVMTGNYHVDGMNITHLKRVQEALLDNVSNDIVKYMLPEAYKTSLVWTINMRSLQNFLTLRTNKAALWEIRELALEVFKQVPEGHKFLLEDYIQEG